jgi:hypothetical protein
MSTATASDLERTPSNLLACAALADGLRALSLPTWHPELYFANTPAERPTPSSNGKG